MFQPIGSSEAMLTICFEGSALPARQGETLAACLLRNGVTMFRTTPVTGAPRMPYCMIGHCFECLVEVEGQGSLQACLTLAESGMRVSRQAGPMSIDREAR